MEVGAYIPSGGSTTHSVTASFAFEGVLGGAKDSTGVFPAIIAMPVSISMTPQNAYIGVGRTQQFTAIGTYGDGSTADITTTATWSSSSASVASVSSGGLVTANAAGTSTISCNFGYSRFGPRHSNSITISFTFNHATESLIANGLNDAIVSNWQFC